MLGSLRARLIISFAVTVALAVFLAGAGALFLLRDQQQETARERYGRNAEPINERVTTLLAQRGSLDEVIAVVGRRAEELDIRLVVIDEDLLVVHDTGGLLQDKYILSFENRDLRVVDENGARYKWANYDSGEEDLTLFAAPPRSGDAGFAAPDYEVFVAIPQSQLSSAWLELAPRLALAGAIALAVSFGVAYFISRSISGPLARITEASQKMAQGDYDVHIPISGQDEVGRLSEAFNAMAREVNSSQRMMRDLLANVSHELKTPLTSIQGFSQAIIDGEITDQDAYKDSVKIINEEAVRMRGLVDDLLLLSQIESGQVVMQPSNIDLADLLERTLERFQWKLREANILTGFSAAHLPMVYGDERRLEQVFSNLLENAVRHTPGGGNINVAATVGRSGKIDVRVHNTGSYIPPEDAERVFERFFQVDRARARKGGSSGLGLAIVAEIVEAHGGTVSVMSDEYTGTEFLVTLPGAAAETRRRRNTAIDTLKPKRTPKKREAPA
jgi:signal transduction histidine kinase